MIYLKLQQTMIFKDESRQEALGGHNLTVCAKLPKHAQPSQESRFSTAPASLVKNSDCFVVLTVMF